MKHAALVLPAIRGRFGDWIYYSCLMPIDELGNRVSYAEEIHKDKALSQLIQRSLEGPRSKHIVDYLKTKERFFNSLVLATYGGSPDWLEVGDFRANTDPTILKQIPDFALDAMGFLRLNGSEKMFAIDGQHRLAGIKRATEEKLSFGGDQLPVILVGHKKSEAGLRRTRRLFTTLNKTAVPVRKRDIIALDEDDAMAIIARRLVETNPSFKDPKIAVIASSNIPVGNRVCLTTISSLYDILKLLFMHEIGQRTDRSLRFNRPSDERLDSYEKLAVDYFTAVGKAFKPVNDLLKSNDPSKVTGAYRGPQGGHLLFRPIGLDSFTRSAIEFSRQGHLSIVDAVQAIKNIPTDLATAPYRNVIWSSSRHTMLPAGKTLGRDLIRYMVGLPVDEDRLLIQYRIALQVEEDDESIRLPRKII
jgi:DNA sulfur modification protein DndB